MPKFKIYAGLGGGFGGATYQGTWEYRNEDDASDDAYRMAVEAYENIEGYHGLKSWKDAVEEAELQFSEIEDYNQSEFDDLVEEIYLGYQENWLDYWVEEVTDETDIEEK